MTNKSYLQDWKVTFLIYLATQAQNGLEAFRMRIKDGKPVVYDRIHTNFTHKRPDEQVFHF